MTKNFSFLFPGFRLLQSIFVVTIFFAFSCTKNETSTNGAGASVSPAGERSILDTAYGAAAAQKMDIYLPAGRSSATKLIVLIHGGGWETGSKEDLNAYKNILRSLWPEAAIANINYRLASNANNVHYPEIMNDVNSAVNFLISNKNNFVVSDTVLMLGASAGAQLAMLYTYGYNNNNYVRAVADFYGPAVLNDWEWYNSFNIWVGKAVKDVLTQYNNAPWDTTLYKSNSPYSRATAGSKPTIIFHGTLDLVVPLYQSQWLHGQLDKLGVKNEYYEYLLDGHGFNSTNTMDALTKTVAFFKKNLK